MAQGCQVLAKKVVLYGLLIASNLLPTLSGVSRIVACVRRLESSEAAQAEAS